MADDARLLALVLAQLGNPELGDAAVAQAVRALRARHGAARPPLADLARALAEDGDPALRPLAQRLAQVRSQRAIELHRLRAQGAATPADLLADLADLPADLPLGWTTQLAALTALRTALDRCRDRRALAGRRAELQDLAARVDAALDAAVEALRTLPWPWAPTWCVGPEELLARCRAAQAPEDAIAAAARVLPVPAPPPADEDAAAWRAYADRQGEDAALAALWERLVAPQPPGRALLDLALAWPSDRVRPLLLRQAELRGERERLELALTLRLGRARAADGWRAELAGEQQTLAGALAAAAPALRAHPCDLLWLWAMARGAEAAAVAPLRELPQGTPIADWDLARRWERELAPAEHALLLGLELGGAARQATAPAVARPADAAPVATAPAPAPERGAPEPPSAREPEPPSPLAEAAGHLWSLVAAHRFLVVGIAMLVVGSLVVGWYAWDRHPLVRYLGLPLLFAGATAGIGALGSWLQRRDPGLAGTAALLRAAAVALVPVNLLILAAMAGDPLLPRPGALVAGAGAALLAAAWAGQRRWSAGVHAALRAPLGWGLAAIDATLVLAALGKSAGAGAHAGVALAGGAYLGFVAAALALIVALRALARAQAPPLAAWFAAGTLLVAWGECFVMGYALLDAVPLRTAHAPLAVGAGALVLLLERHLGALGARATGVSRQRPESFLGYALVMLGVLLGAGDPVWRAITCAAAATVWLVQARRRTGPGHWWIGLALAGVASAAFPAIEGYPRWALPAPALLGAIAAGIAADRIRAASTALSTATAPLRAAAATGPLLGAIAAALATWHAGLGAGVAAAWILAAAALLGWRSHRDRSLALAHGAALLVAAAMPFLGLVDLAQSRHGNHMPAGLAALAALWMALAAARPGTLLARSRSSVPLLLGALGLAAFLLRVAVEGVRPEDALPLNRALDLLGPAALCAVLLVATWTSRSLLPAIIAVLIAAVLAPELRATLEDSFGGALRSGLGGAIAALLCGAIALRLRANPRLRALADGDPLLDRPFPLQRRDHTLLGWPLLAAAAVLLARLDTVVIVRHLGTDSWRTPLAVAIGGIAWACIAAHLRGGAGVALGWLGLAGWTLGTGWLACRLGLGVGWRGAGLAAVGAALAWWAAGRSLARRDGALDALLADPARGALSAAGSAGGVALALAALAGADADPQLTLTATAAALLVWRGAASGLAAYGVVLLALGVAVAGDRGIPGAGPVLLRAGFADGLVWPLAVLLAAQLADVWTGGRATRAVDALVRPARRVADAAFVLAGLVALLPLAAGGWGHGPGIAALALGVLAAALGNCSGWALLLAVAVAYLGLHADAALPLQRALEPWRMATLALVLALSAAVLRPVPARLPALAVRLRAQRWMVADPERWLRWCALVLAALPTLRHLLAPAMSGDDPGHDAAPWLCAAAFAAVAWARRAPVALTGLLLGLWGGIAQQVLRHAAPLLDDGIGRAHLWAAALVATTPALLALGRLPWDAALRAAARDLAAAAAIGTLVLLGFVYADAHDLAAMSSLRFPISAGIALAAGLVLRADARGRDPASTRAALMEPLWHLALTIALWCLGLWIPALRQPATALLALALPALWLWLRAELARDVVRRRRLVRSAAAVALAVLALYALRPAYHALAFPAAPQAAAHWHVGAAVALAMGMVLLRLTGLGGGRWLAVAGGGATMAALHFLVTATPGLRPAAEPAAAAWSALVLAQVLVLAVTRSSPVADLVLALTRGDAALWLWLRAAWGRLLLVGASSAVAWGMADHDRHPLQMAPLIAGLATVWAHVGWVRRRRWQLLVAAALLGLALHADLAVPSLLRLDHALWALLLLWAIADAALLIVDRRAGAVTAVVALLCVGHALWQGPDTVAGLAGVGCIVACLACTPRPAPPAGGQADLLAGAALLLAPAWLAGWGRTAGGPPLHAALAATAAALVATAWACGACARTLGPTWTALGRRRSLLLDHPLAAAARHGGELEAAGLWAAMAVAAAALGLHHRAALAPADAAVLGAALAGAGAAWIARARRAPGAGAVISAQLCAGSALLLVRDALLHAGIGWTPAHDVWAALGASLAVLAVREAVPPLPALRAPLAGSLVALPLLALAWTWHRGLSSDLALLVTGLHAAVFAWAGRGRRDAAWHLGSVACGVGAALILLHTRLGLRSLDSYVIPVGVGVLALVQLFARHADARTRNGVRLAALLAMLAAVGWRIVAARGVGMAPHITMIALGLAVMGLGALLRVRLHLALGSAAVLLDLAVLVAQALGRADRSTRMAALGGCVLVAGALLVAATVYYQTHRDAVDAALARWRRRLDGWD